MSSDTSWATSSIIQNQIINSTATSDVNYLTNVAIPEANRYIDDIVFGDIDNLPLAANLTADLQNAANLYAGSMWFEMNKDYKQAKALMDRVKDIVASVIKRAKATPTLRHTMQGKNKGYYSDPLQSEGLQVDMADTYY